MSLNTSNTNLLPPLLALIVSIVGLGAVHAQSERGTTSELTIAKPDLLSGQHYLRYYPKGISLEENDGVVTRKGAYNTIDAKDARAELTDSGQLLGLRLSIELGSKKSAGVKLEKDAPVETETSAKKRYEDAHAALFARNTLATPVQHSTSNELEHPSANKKLPYEKTGKTQQLTANQTTDTVFRGLGPIFFGASEVLLSPRRSLEVLNDSSDNATVYRYGLRRTSRSSESWQSFGGLASKLNQNLAMGIGFEHSNNESDYLFSAGIVNKTQSLLITSSWGYQRSHIDFPFATGTATTKLSQRSQLIKLDWKPLVKDEGIQPTLTLRSWHTKTGQGEHLPPVYFVKETPIAYETYKDSRSLILGELKGYSAIGVNIPLNDRWRLGQTVGRERLKFSNPNGSEDLLASDYRSTEIQFQLTSGLARVVRQSGASESRTIAAYNSDGWSLTATKANSRFESANYWSIGIGFTKILGGGQTLRFSGKPAKER